jgi:hypothetical protein
MPRQDIDEDIDDKDRNAPAADVDELDESDRMALMEAENEALVEAHAAESSLPWYAFDLLFRPRLAALRWTQDADDRLRDRAVAIAASFVGGGVLWMAAASRFPRSWGPRFEFVSWTFASFLLVCVLLAGSAKVYDAIGRGLGAQENYDRIRVVLAMMLIPPLLVAVPVSVFRLIFGDGSEVPHDRDLMPAGIEWLFLAGYGAWLGYFPIGALRAVQLFPLRKAIGNHVVGMISTALFWLVVGIVVYFVVKLTYWIFNLGTFVLF